jgi:hypothetical protein
MVLAGNVYLYAHFQTKSTLTLPEFSVMPSGKKRKRAKIAKHKRKKRLRKNRHKKK